MEEKQLDFEFTPNLRKIKRSVKSMKEQMKITENEKFYRLENFKFNNVKDNYIKEFKCTKCDKSFQKGKEICVHPLLEVLMCSSCCDFYGDGDFSMGSDEEDKYCRWCGEGGTIFSCSKCICGFCDNCIRKHFGEETLKQIEKDDDWKCYFCDPMPLWSLRAICSLAKQISNSKKEQKKRKRENTALKRKRSKIILNKDSDEGNLFSFVNQNFKMNALKTEDSGNELNMKKKKNDEGCLHDVNQELFNVKFEEKKNKIILKLKGIWKIMHLLMEIGLKASEERLKILPELTNINTIKDFQAEYKKLRIILKTIKSYLDKTVDPIESLKLDLNLENAADEEINIISLGQSGEENFQEKIDTELKRLNSIEIGKPILKVKSFAKMTSENLLNPKTNNCSIDAEKYIINQNFSNNETIKKQIYVEEYSKETDESTDEKSIKKKETSSGSEFSEEDNPNIILRNSKKNIQEIFKNFRKKRQNFIKKNYRKKQLVGNEKNDKSLINLESSDDNSCTKNIKSRSTKISKIEFSNKEEEKFTSLLEKGEKIELDCNKDSSECSSSFEKSDSSKSTFGITRKINLKNKSILKRFSNQKKISDSSNSENEEQEKNVKKINRKRRRNINKIINKEFLQFDTKQAIWFEKERRNRLEKRKQLFKVFFSNESNTEETPKQLILDFDEKTKEPSIVVHKKLLEKLKPHQIEGVKFMWNNCFESVSRLKNYCGTGCILAHCMGFGKTLQVITLIHTVMSYELGVHTVLIICPLSTISVWIREFSTWLEDVDSDVVIVYDLLKSTSYKERVLQIKNWKKNGGVMILSYDIFRNLSKQYKNSKKHTFKLFKEALLNPGPDLVICDEGHLLKNEGSTLSKCINLIKTSRRIVLTGTPLQNNLMEYYYMMQFVKPNFLGSKKEFCNRFINPITNGQFEDSTEEDVKLMKRRSHVLHSMLKDCVQRFGFSELASYLPEKKEFVLLISLTKSQLNAYNYFINTLPSKLEGSFRGITLFNDFHNLQKIWTHPRAFLIRNNKVFSKKIEQTDSEGSLRDFIVHTDEETTRSSCSGEESNVEGLVFFEKKNFMLTENYPEVAKDNDQDIKKNVNKYWWNDFFLEKDFEDIRASNKLLVLLSLLNQCGKEEEKVLVFSQFLTSLDIIEYFLNKVDENNTKGSKCLGSFHDSWILGIDYFRLDGSTSRETRAAWCRSFNLVSNKRGRLFLISTKAGGLGINLTGANRVVIFDASWNPSNDLQSIFRVYRFGQKKKCYIYRFLAEGTMEEKIYKRQITKLSLSQRVIDEYQIERHYSMGNLQELYKFEPLPKEKRKIFNLPKDNVLAELLSFHKDAIVSFHEQDSLLENKEEEELSEQEKIEAWSDYNEEKQKKNVPNMDRSQYLQHIQTVQCKTNHVPQQE